MPDAVTNSRNPYEIQEIEISNRTMSRIIIGVSVDQGGIDLFGQHVFIMYIDLKKPHKSVMLDASGHYGEGRSSDIVDGYQMPITIESYIKYWDVKEDLYTFEPIIDETDKQIIRDLIISVEGRSNFSCTVKASALLKDSGLFNGLKDRCFPRRFLQDLESYAKENPGTMIIKKYDMKSDKEIPYEG